MILKYCTTGVLTELEIDVLKIPGIESPLQFDFTLMEKSRPYFQGLRKLELSDETSENDSILNDLYHLYEQGMNNLEKSFIGVSVLINCQDLIGNKELKIFELNLSWS